MKAQTKITLLVTDSHLGLTSSSVHSSTTLKDKENTMKLLKQRPMVSFDIENIKVNFVDRVEDMPISEVDATWYDKEDYEYIMEDVEMTLKLMKAGREKPEKFGFCYRGLEYQPTANGLRRKITISRASKAVLREQGRQKEDCISDAESIANRYHEHTAFSVTAAIRKAAEDADVVAKTGLEPDEDMKNLAVDELEFEVIDEDDVSVLSDDFSEEEISEGLDDFASPSRKGFVRQWKRMLRGKRHSNSTKN